MRFIYIFLGLCVGTACQPNQPAGVGNSTPQTHLLPATYQVAVRALAGTTATVIATVAIGDTLLFMDEMSDREHPIGERDLSGFVGHGGGLRPQYRRSGAPGLRWRGREAGSDLGVGNGEVAAQHRARQGM